MKINQKSIFYPFLFAIFPIIYLYSINFVETPLFDVILPMLISLSGTFVLLIITRLILKTWIKSGLVISLLLILSFSYGHLYELINTSIMSEFEIGRHRYLMIEFFAIFVIGTIIIIRTKIKTPNSTIILNSIAITLIVLTIPNFIFSDNSQIDLNPENLMISNNNLSSNSFEISYVLENLDQLKSQEKPDIYYILLDGYGGTMRMKEDLNFDNYEFLSNLNDRGFFAPDKSNSNYPSSGWSIASIFGMNYLPSNETNQSNTEYRNLLSGIIRNNEVMRNLDYLDYEIINFQPNGFITQNYQFVDQAFCQQEESSQSKFVKTLLRTTILNHVNNLLIVNVDRASILCGFSEIVSLDEKNDKPIFAVMMLRLPHPPYVFGADGEHVIGDKVQTEEGSFVNEEKYVDTIKFANKKTIEMVDIILKHNNNSIIIIQSDHGYDFGINYENPSDLQLKQRLSNLNAIYLPNSNDGVFYEGITPVNVFRIIFNEYFDASYDVLDDKMFYHHYGGSNLHNKVNFEDVTEIILN